mgnify:CR=1 FL=1
MRAGTCYYINMATNNEVLSEMLAEAERRHEYAKERLRAAAVSMTDRMERLVRNVDAGLSVNELGEVQASGPALDILCAEYVRTAQQITITQYYLGRTES